MFCDIPEALKEIWLTDETLADIAGTDKIYSEDITYNENLLNYVTIRELGELGAILDDDATCIALAYRITLYAKAKADQRNASIACYPLYQRARFDTNEGRVESCRIARRREFRQPDGVRVLWIELNLRVSHTTPNIRVFESESES